MKFFFRSAFYGIITHRKSILFLIILFFGIIVGIDLVGRAVSYFPNSCKLCHYMKPYYDQWTTSSHNKVRCIKCHSFRFNYMLSSVIKYATNTQIPRPHAYVDDKACLQKGCHSNRLLEGPVQFENSISFNHSDHIGSAKRGVYLKCSSCHYTLIQTKDHLAVDKNVCFLCHFKDIGKGQAISGCKACHGEPKKPVEHEGFTFEHEAYLKLGVDCNQCHLEVAEGKGEVPEELCHKCHAERVEHYSDYQFIHKKHVTQKGIDCFECHNKIKHGEIHMIQALETQCTLCHSDLHTEQKEMYMGINGRGVKDTPSRMFAAQVSCDGCHQKVSIAGEIKQITTPKSPKEILRASCVACHGKGYDLMLDDWIRETDKLVIFLEPHLLIAEGTIAKRPSFAKSNPEIANLIIDARHNFNLLKTGRGAHNVEFSVYLAQETMNKLDQVMKKLVPDYNGPARPEILTREDAFCTALCHNIVKPKDIVFFKEMQIDFPHSQHTTTLGITCTTCHSASKHKQRIISKSACIDCHHNQKGMSCEHCHKVQGDFYQGKFSYKDVKGSPDVMAAAGIPCTGCHDLKEEDQSIKTINLKCYGCHGEGYDQKGIDWLKNLTTKENAIALKLVELNNQMEERHKKGLSVKHVEPLVIEIENGFQNIRKTSPIHNYNLSSEVFDKLEKDIDQVKILLEGTK